MSTVQGCVLIAIDTHTHTRACRQTWMKTSYICVTLLEERVIIVQSGTITPYKKWMFSLIKHFSTHVRWLSVLISVHTLAHASQANDLLSEETFEIQNEFPVPRHLRWTDGQTDSADGLSLSALSDPPSIITTVYRNLSTPTFLPNHVAS